MFSPYTPTEYKQKDAASPSNIEPMTLGSPVSSPKNKVAVNHNYLPSYLFGEAVTSPIGLPISWSSPKQSNISASNLVNPVFKFREQDISYQSPSSPSIINTPNPGKSGGPPVQGLLYSSPNHTSFNTSQLENLPSAAERLVSESHSFSAIPSPHRSRVPNVSHLSPAQIDPFFTQGEELRNSDQLDESWVTVFGFPSVSSAYIMQQFSQYGNIVKHKISPTGNWMHLRYQSKLQAKKALSKNGKIFATNIMIGVKPCIEMDLMESRDNSAFETSVPGLNSSQGDHSEPTKPNLKRIRLLTQAYQSPTSGDKVTAPESGNIVKKALDFIWKKE